MSKTEELKAYFEGIDENKRALAFDTIEEYVFALEKMAELKNLPFIRISKSNPAKQEQTPAAKLYKDFSQTVDNKRKILLMILYRVSNSAADELLAKLSEFETR